MRSMLVIALLVVLGAGGRTAAAQPTDAQLLLAWKASIADTWNSLSSWTGTDACIGTWTGVTCTNGRVMGLRLGGLGLAGKIPASGWNWPSSLQFAILNKNWFSGQLPSNWSLPALTSLYLSDNNFEGTLPTWDTMPSTQVFIKPGNSYLCGPVPSTPQYLDVMGTPVTLPVCKSDAELLLDFKAGITDTWNSLASWTGSNACSGSWAYVTCSQGRVVALRLGGLGLRGTIPAQTMLPPGVKYVYMNKNWFSGQIPQAWTVPSGLLELYVSDNNFEGALPSWNLPNTKVFIRPGNSYLCGQMPQFPGYYDAAGNRIWALPPGPCKTDAQLLLAWKASIADDAGALASWTGSDPCGGTWAGVSCAQGRVTRIKLDGLFLRGTITPATWLFPATLSSLNVANNNFSGGLPVALTLPPNIQEFRIFGNSFTGPLPAWTNLVDTKVYISPGNSGLCGTVPQWPAFYSAATDARIWALAACQGRKLKLM